MKKAAVLVVVLLAAAAAAVWFLLWGKGPAAGGTVQVGVLLRKADKVGALQIALTYNPAAGVVEAVEPGELARGALIEANLKTRGRAVIGLVNVEGISGDGAVAVLRLRPAPGGPATPLTLEAVQAYHAETRYELVARATAGHWPGGAGPCTPPTLDFGR